MLSHSCALNESATAPPYARAASGRARGGLFTRWPGRIPSEQYVREALKCQTPLADWTPSREGGTMSAVTFGEAYAKAGLPFTVEELDRLPDDGRRYELRRRVPGRSLRHARTGRATDRDNDRVCSEPCRGPRRRGRQCEVHQAAAARRRD